MAHPSLSIVTPCLNAATTIGRALDSVRAQGHEGVEMIVIDGGSSDGTQQIVAEYPEAILVSEPDAGQSDAMNKGFDLASGEIVGWMNADDWYLPGAFDAVCEAVARNPSAEWFTGRCPIVDGSGNPIRHLVTAYKNFLLDRYSFTTYLTQNFISCPATFVERDALRAVGSLRLDYRYSMDYDLFLRLARRGDPVVIPRDLAVFVMEEGTRSMRGFEKQFQEHAAQAREHGEGHRLAVAVNGIMSRAIVLVYRLLRAMRGLQGSPPKASQH